MYGGGCGDSLSILVAIADYQRDEDAMERDFDDYGVELVVMNQESKSHEEELRDLNSFSCIYGKRRAKRIVQTIKGESVHG